MLSTQVARGTCGCPALWLSGCGADTFPAAPQDSSALGRRGPWVSHGLDLPSCLHRRPPHVSGGGWHFQGGGRNSSDWSPHLLQHCQSKNTPENTAAWGGDLPPLLSPSALWCWDPEASCMLSQAEPRARPWQGPATVLVSRSSSCSDCGISRVPCGGVKCDSHSPGMRPRTSLCRSGPGRGTQAWAKAASQPAGQ